ncbi:HAMP domain-containing histidine kinase [Curtobacterium flaccumfaciens]|uniref:sensor histidine kinase n=1 Tax=Curtobacterium flaccumfaciens TaxID=2035 RepID=UPI0022095DD0|nr:HAMP domain-containing sensor histidine kinase [Curtobacterium flaccumfaciens]UWD84184.1 HAMP domain-containing histidine kinase [Curtobacterium flaccumfaciens]
MRIPALHRPSIRARLTLTYTALILLTGAVMLAVVFAVLAIVPGYAFTAGPFPYGSTHDVYEITGRDDVLRLFVIVSVPALLVVGGIGGVVSWLVAGRLLRPLRDIITTADRLGAGTLDARVDVSGPPDEIRDVGATLNRMLDRLETAFVSRSRFAANASHELRTPLATMKTMLQVALRTPDGPDRTQTLERLLVTTDQMIRMTTALLDLARGDEPIDARPVSLRDEVAAALLAVDAERLARRIVVSVQLDDVVVLGNRPLLGQLVGNLIRNAVVHNVSGGSLRVVLDDRSSELRVENDGEVIPTVEAHELTEPFRRRHRTRTNGSGHGLGLPLVAMIATVHGAELTLTPRAAGGLTASTRFPERQPPDPEGSNRSSPRVLGDHPGVR